MTKWRNEGVRRQANISQHFTVSHQIFHRVFISCMTLVLKKQAGGRKHWLCSAERTQRLFQLCAIRAVLLSNRKQHCFQIFKQQCSKVCQQSKSTGTIFPGYLGAAANASTEHLSKELGQVRRLWTEQIET